MSPGRELANSKEWLNLERRKNANDEEYMKFFRYIHNALLIFLKLGKYEKLLSLSKHG